MDEIDLEEQFGSLVEAFHRFRAPALLVSFTTDWLFPSAEMARVATAMREAGGHARHVDLDTANGHDAFLVDYDLITPLVRDFLATI